MEKVQDENQIEFLPSSEEEAKKQKCAFLM